MKIVTKRKKDAVIDLRGKYKLEECLHQFDFDHHVICIHLNFV